MTKPKNTNLNKAGKAKEDEFYTQLSDIENELKHYKNHFKDKTVFLNCDDPLESNFWKYFELNFDYLGLKKLISTHYDPKERTYKLELSRDKEGKVFVEKTELEQNGDFRSPECIELLKEADIVCTNPPFSLFREYIAQLFEYNKNFLIIGSQNNATYKEIFPLIKSDRLWFGYGFNGGNAYFRVPEGKGEGYAKGVYDEKTGLVKFRNCTWFTNLQHNKRYEDLILVKHYTPTEYPTYDNYNAIEVSKVAEIPKDYEGEMGVPITFLSSYNPQQFEIIGLDRYTVPKEKLVGGRLTVNGKIKYARILIRKKEKENEN